MIPTRHWIMLYPEEKDAILRALEHARYNKTATTKLLGITFRVLRVRQKQLGLE